MKEFHSVCYLQSHLVSFLASHFIVHTHLLNHDPSSFSWEEWRCWRAETFLKYLRCVEVFYGLLGLLLFYDSHTCDFCQISAKCSTIFSYLYTIQQNINNSINILSFTLCEHIMWRIGWRFTQNRQFVRIFLNLITRLMDRVSDLPLLFSCMNSCLPSALAHSQNM